jgi:hypothetical protein
VLVADAVGEKLLAATFAHDEQQPMPIFGRRAQRAWRWPPLERGY